MPKTTYIVASNETVEKLADSFSCSQKFVHLALSCSCNSKLAAKIRMAAVSDFGAVKKTNVPECETMHSVEKDGKQYMRQIFANGVELIWLKGTPEVKLKYRGKEHLFLCYSLEQFSQLQATASNMMAELPLAQE